MKSSGIITMLTDFGIVDPYVSMMKGVILSINPEAVIVDVSHSIKTGGIAEAAMVIQETYPFFPKGTIHIAVVDPGVGTGRRMLGIKADGHLFVGPDNGLLWPVISNSRDIVVVHLMEQKYFLPHITRTFHGRDVFAPVSAHLSLDVGLEQIGTVIYDPVEISLPMPKIKDDILYGEIARIDNFGNLITDIKKEVLENFLEKSNALISIGNFKISGVNNTYFEAEEGEPLALINSSGLLEIAVNMGRASEYAGISMDEITGAVIKISRD
jgi:S-adenosyl-L-methionine hydrolase (adenosine-forming)